jgi:adenylosuccinate synthase
MADRKVILVLSGEISSGKSTLADKLVNRFGFSHCKTREGLRLFGEKKLSGKEPDRTFLLKFGEELDKKDDGKWVLNYFQELFAKDFSSTKYYIVDSVRILNQVKHFRRAYGSSIYHIHLKASPTILKNRFLSRKEQDLAKVKLLEKYSAAKANSTEAKVHELEKDADLVIDTDRCIAEDVLIRVASFLKLLSSTDSALVDVIVGGQFGSEGKGQISAHIAPDYDCLMRVGGPNAGHSVFEFPKHDVFHLLPSGTRRNPNSLLLIGAGAVINIDKVLEEIKYFGVEDNARLIIDENVTVIRQEDIEKEQKVKDKIGSTAQGVGLATSNNIIARLHNDSSHKAKNFNKLKPYLGSTLEKLESCYRENKKILLEGTQGTNLSIHHGLYPHVTSRDTTVSGCLSEAGISPRRVRKIIMVTRTYPIRVAGNSGMFQSAELKWSDISKRSGKDVKILKASEKTTTTKRDRRVAEFSWSLFRKACELNSPTDIALTFVDYISKQNEKVRRYDQLTPETRQMIEELERCSGVKVSLLAINFDYRSVIDRRNWR